MRQIINSIIPVLFAVALMSVPSCNTPNNGTRTSKTDDKASTPERIGFIQHLPDDGVWASYLVKGKGEGQDTSHTATVRMVGTTTEKGQKCRWIELDGDNTLFKFLVREDDLAADAKGMPVIIRIWAKQGNNPVTELDDQARKAHVERLFGKQMEVKAVNAKKVVNWKKGRMKLAMARQGKQIVSKADEEKIEQTVTVWSHQTSPFGTVLFKTSFKTGGKTEAEITALFQDHGTGAESALPDNN